MRRRGGSGGWALVLGPGGPVGTAWLAGLAAGLRRSGVDPAAAALIVGTSAGAIAGAMITTGRDLAAVAELPLQGRDRPPDEVLPEERHRAGMEYLVGTDEWPGGRHLLVTAVDVESGEPVVWDGSDDGVPLTAAVAASSAAPGFAEPVTIGGRRYMDGAFGGGSNAHLAAGAGTVVLIEPLPQTPDDSGADVWIVPDERAREAFGDDVGDMARWTPAYREGLRQAPAAAELIAAAVRGPAG
ncbi:patatin-like phospholipase family protein [Actinomadura sp. KC06]|uniref:patatin-like phospholipase family protein n=1 Tax=Actinomadura sp. KC06 TaxID=2530369 RepID=UPI00104BEB2A|nr:patatin-like phospholipase family protein [Actinomadura sp. KC06]TDD35130.1 patatin-like phospholipase family protein [Actinomadura sp. KC06]